jgi:hypothetical protein
LAGVFEVSKWYVVGKEIGEESKIPHLQGYVEFTKKIRPMGYMGMPKEIHWEKAKGSLLDNYKYCTKEGDFVTNIRKPRENPIIELWGWQLKAKAIFESEPDNRSIHWFYSKEGQYGKSSFVRWAVDKGAVICSGKGADAKYLVVKYQQQNGFYPDVIIFDVPRSNEKYLCYSGLEDIKNGVFASTKFECEMVTMPYPHIFIFANFTPDMNNKDLSKDRIRLYDLELLN